MNDGWDIEALRRIVSGSTRMWKDLTAEYNAATGQGRHVRTLRDRCARSGIHRAECERVPIDLDVLRRIVAGSRKRWTELTVEYNKATGESRRFDTLRSVALRNGIHRAVGADRVNRRLGAMEGSHRAAVNRVECDDGDRGPEVGTLYLTPDELAILLECRATKHDEGRWECYAFGPPVGPACDTREAELAARAKATGWPAYTIRQPNPLRSWPKGMPRVARKGVA